MTLTLQQCIGPLKTTVHTAGYTRPSEITKSTREADIYVFGLIGRELLLRPKVVAEETRKRPETPRKQLRRLLEGEDDMFINIVLQCLSMEPSQRPTANDIAEAFLMCDPEDLLPV